MNRGLVAIGGGVVLALWVGHCWRVADESHLGGRVLR